VSRIALLVLAGVALASCNARPKPPAEEAATELPSQLPSPKSNAEGFAVGDDVSLIEDDGRFTIDLRVLAVTDAPRAYQIRVGANRFATTKWYPAAQVFPAPWAGSARFREGDAIYEIRFGKKLEPYKCVVQEVPADVRANIKAKCDGYSQPSSIARRDAFHAIEPATLSALAEGEIVYYDGTQWAMVVGKPPGGRVAIRVNGFAQKDQLVSVAKLQRVR
jgi:hypothetical protein